MAVLVFGKSSFEIDADYPGGNIVVERIRGDTAYIHQDIRDTKGWWFYWNFRVRGAAGRTLVFRFTNRDPIGLRGPAVSTDAGATWSWLGRKTVKKTDKGASFIYTFPKGAKEIRFCFSIPYQLSDLQRFLKTHAKNPHLGVRELCKSRKGRSVERLHLGKLQGEPMYRVLLTCRHHSCETTASYCLEGILKAILAETDDGQWFRRNVEVMAIPFMDKDGVEEGDQGKNRKPYDHNRDYAGKSIYPSVAALRKFVPKWSNGKLRISIDMHSPSYNDKNIFFFAGKAEPLHKNTLEFCHILEQQKKGSLVYSAKNNKYSDPLPKMNRGWCSKLPGVLVPVTIEFPYATAAGKAVTADSARAFGCNLAHTIRQYLEKTNSGIESATSGPVRDNKVKKQTVFQRIRAVRLNALGLKRVNAERISRGKPFLDTQLAVSPPDDTVTGDIDAPSEFEIMPSQVDNSALKSFPEIRSQNFPPKLLNDPNFIRKRRDRRLWGGDVSSGRDRKDREHRTGACQSFAIVYYQFTHNNRLLDIIDGKTVKDNKDNDDHTKYSPQWVHNFASRRSGTMYTDIYPILRDHGAATWAQCPFERDKPAEWNTDPDSWLSALSHRIEQAEYIADVDTEAGIRLIKQMLINGYGIIIYTPSRGRLWMTFSDDPATDADDTLVCTKAVAMASTRGGHAMCAIGYNDDVWTDINQNGKVDNGEKGAFKVSESSFVDRQGDNSGFRWFSYDSIRRRSSVPDWSPEKRKPAWNLFDHRAYHLVIGNRRHYQPKIIARFTLHHKVRGQVKVALGVSDVGQTEPTRTWQPHLFSGRNKTWYFKDRAFDGTSTACEATFVLDFTDLVGTDSEKPRRFYLIVEDTKNENPLTLKDFRVIHLGTTKEAIYPDCPKTVDAGKVIVWVDSVFTTRRTADRPMNTY